MKNLLVTSMAGAALLLSISGCHSPGPPHYEPFDTAASHSSAARMVTVTNRLDPAWLKTPTNLFTLGPGDRVEVELLDDPASRVTTVVGPDGKIYFNLLPGLDVWGLTLGQAKKLMEQNLARLNGILNHRLTSGRERRRGVRRCAAQNALCSRIAS